MEFPRSSNKMKLIFCTFLLIYQAKAQFFFGNRDALEEPEKLKLRPCFVPTGKSTFCVPLKECPYVSDLVKNLNKPLAQDVALLIQDSFFCPREDSSSPIEICCPLEGIEPAPEDSPILPDKDECITQTGAEATCAIYNSCSPFLQLLLNLKRPIQPSLPALMRGSWLCGFENQGGFNFPKICCPKDAIIDKTRINTTPSTTTSTTTTTTTTISTVELEK